MTKKIVQIIKLILVGFSITFVIMKRHDTAMCAYWIGAALYWFFNFLSGLETKK